MPDFTIPPALSTVAIAVRPDPEIVAVNVPPVPDVQVSGAGVRGMVGVPTVFGSYAVDGSTRKSWHSFAAEATMALALDAFAFSA